MGRRTTAGLVLLASLAAPGAHTQRDLAPIDEFPASDLQTISGVGRVQRAREVRNLVATRPGDPEAFRALIGQERYADVITAMKHLESASPASVVAALAVVGEFAFMFKMDQTRGHASALAAALAPIRGRLSSLAREDAAALARQLLVIDGTLEQSAGPSWQERLSAFVKEYDGTETALVARADLIDDYRANLLQRIDALDAFARAHPRTIAGARALYLKGFQLAHNVAATGIERRGSDPSPRFMRVVEVVKELQSGDYPPCEAVEKAPELITGFFYSRDPPPAFAADNLERMIDALREFAIAEAETAKGIISGSHAAYVVESKLGDLFESKGDRIGGIEQVLEEMERRVSDKPAVRLFRGEFYLKESTAGPQPRRAEMAERARATLTALADERAGLASRRALATLAAMAMSARDYAGARPLYAQYLAAYPRTSWSWLAAIRIGQIQQAQGDARSAEASFRRAALDYRDEPMVPLLGAAYAARALEAQGRFDDALPEYRRAIALWDPDFGEALSTAPWEPSRAWPGDDLSPDPTSVTREGLADRAATLARVISIPGGLILERGRWQIEQGRWTEAQATLRGLVKQYPRTPVAAEGRLLLHRAQLEEALATAAISHRSESAAGALRLLDALAAEPPDFFVSAGRIAGAAVRLTAGNRAGATTMMQKALEDLLTTQKSIVSRPIKDAVDADVAAIRRVVFRPMGDLPLFSTGHWNAFTFPSVPPAFLVVRPDVAVKDASGTMTTRSIYQTFPNLKQVVFLDASELGVLTRMVAAIGGTARREPTQVMETPNQPIGVSRDIVSFWNEFFPTRPGHWGGWELETYPQITRIEFLDEARTKASVMVTVGYSGATVVMEKVDGVWKAIRLTNHWIT